MQIGSALVFRAASMAIAFITTLVASWYLTNSQGATAFASYALVTTLLLAVPFADLGLGSDIVNLTSDRIDGQLSRDQYARAMARNVRILIYVSVIVLIVVLVSYWSGLLQGVLGGFVDLSTTRAAAILLALFALGIPLGCGMRVLQGTANISLVLRVGLIGSLFQLGWVLAGVALDFQAPMLAVGAGLALILSNSVMVFFAVRLDATTARLIWTSTLRGSPTSHRPWSMAVPFLVASVGVSIGLSLDRVILAHVSGANAVAEYSLVAQFSVAIASLITMSSMNLWPLYRGRLRANALSVRLFVSHLRLYFLLGVVSAFALLVVVTLFEKFFVGDEVVLPVSATLLGAGYLVIWALVRPATMLLSDVRGMRLQARWVLGMGVVNAMLTVVLGAHFGATGAFAASCVAVLALQTIPLTMMAFRRIANPAHGHRSDA